MTIQNHRLDHGRAAKTAALVNLLADQISLGHPARATVRELQQLYPNRTPNIREMLERVPGRSMAAKGVRIGISRSSIWSIWHGKYTPSDEIMARIEAAAVPAE